MQEDADTQAGSDESSGAAAALLRRGKLIQGQAAHQQVQQQESAQEQGQQQQAALSSPSVTPPAGQSGLYALHAVDIDGADVALSQFAGRVLLIVNVASECGFTEQNYRGLAALHAKYGGHGLEILAFPSNQFGGQEPGGPEEIKRVARGVYGAAFRLMAKVDVNGPNAHPVYQWLKRNLPVAQGGGGGTGPGSDLVWNFNKFLVDKQGRPVAFHTQAYDAPRIEADVYRLLQE